MMDDIEAESTPDDSRITVGSAVISLLGIVFGMVVIVGGTFMTWRSDMVLGLFTSTGWSFSNILSAGDGKISLALGVIGFVSLLLGGALRNRWFYCLALASSVLVLGLFVYELVFIATRTGVVSPGTGLYMLLGGGMVGVLCSLGGYFMVRPQH